jgi:glycine oxidase
MTRVDLTVRGGGIFGLAIAWEATRRGARVRLIERHAIGAGASGGLVGALAPHVPENWNAKKQFQLDSLLMSEAFFASVAQASGLPTGYARTDRLQPIADAASLALARQRGLMALDLWQGHALWQVIETRGSDWIPASPTGFLIRDTLTARIHPRLAIQALVHAIRSRGAEVILGEAPDEGPTIWATGTQGLADLTQALGRAAGDGVKGQAALLAHDARDLPQLFVDAIHVVPHQDGTTAIGSTSEHGVHDTITDTRLEDLIARARAAVPALRDAPVIDRWAALRPRARSRAPILGPWPGRPGHFIANGGFKIGFGMAAKVAQVMADLVLDGRDTIPAGFRSDAP